MVDHEIETITPSMQRVRQRSDLFVAIELKPLFRFLPGPLSRLQSGCVTPAQQNPSKGEIFAEILNFYFERICYHAIMLSRSFAASPRLTPFSQLGMRQLRSPNFLKGSCQACHPTSTEKTAFQTRSARRRSPDGQSGRFARLLSTSRDWRQRPLTCISIVKRQDSVPGSGTLGFLLSRQRRRLRSRFG